MTSLLPMLIPFVASFSLPSLAHATGLLYTPEGIIASLGTAYVLRKNVAFQLGTVLSVAFVGVPMVTQKLWHAKRYVEQTTHQVSMQAGQVSNVARVKAKRICKRLEEGCDEAKNKVKRRFRKRVPVEIRLFRSLKNLCCTIVNSRFVRCLMKYVVLALFFLWLFDMFNRYRLHGRGGKGGNMRFASQKGDRLGMLPDKSHPAPEEDRVSDGPTDQGHGGSQEQFAVPHIVAHQDDPNTWDPQTLYLMASTVYDIPHNAIPRFVVATQTLQRAVASGQMPQRALDLFLAEKGNLLLPGEKPVAGLEEHDALTRRMRALDRQGRIKNRQQKAIDAQRSRRTPQADRQQKAQNHRTRLTQARQISAQAHDQRHKDAAIRRDADEEAQKKRQKSRQESRQASQRLADKKRAQNIQTKKDKAQTYDQRQKDATARRDADEEAQKKRQKSRQESRQASQRLADKKRAQNIQQKKNKARIDDQRQKDAAARRNADEEAQKKRQKSRQESRQASQHLADKKRAQNIQQKKDKARIDDQRQKDAAARRNADAEAQKKRQKSRQESRQASQHLADKKRAQNIQTKKDKAQTYDQRQKDAAARRDADEEAQKKRQKLHQESRQTSQNLADKKRAQNIQQKKNKARIDDQRHKDAAARRDADEEAQKKRQKSREESRQASQHLADKKRAQNIQTKKDKAQTYNQRHKDAAARRKQHINPSRRYQDRQRIAKNNRLIHQYQRRATAGKYTKKQAHVSQQKQLQVVDSQTQATQYVPNPQGSSYIPDPNQAIAGQGSGGSQPSSDVNNPLLVNSFGAEHSDTKQHIHRLSGLGLEFRIKEAFKKISKEEIDRIARKSEEVIKYERLISKSKLSAKWCKHFKENSEFENNRVYFNAKMHVHEYNIKNLSEHQQKSLDKARKEIKKCKQSNIKVKNRIVEGGSAFVASCAVQCATSTIGTAYNIYKGNAPIYNSVSNACEHDLQGKQGLDRTLQHAKNTVRKVDAFVTSAIEEAPPCTEVMQSAAGSVAGGTVGAVLGAVATTVTLGNPSVGAQIGGSVCANMGGTMAVDNSVHPADLFLKASWAMLGQVVIPIPVVGGLVGATVGEGIIQAVESPTGKKILSYLF